MEKGNCEVGNRGIIFGWLVRPVITDEERQAEVSMSLGDNDIRFIFSTIMSVQWSCSECLVQGTLSVNRCDVRKG